MDKGFADAIIMVVDDSTANLMLLTELLESQGMAVQAFVDGRSALAAAATRPPDLILLDITMPEMDGFEVCQQLKADPALAEIPVLFLSGLAETSDKVKAFASGAVDYVTKPFQLAEILARIRTHLSLRRLRLELSQQNLRLEQLVREKVAEITDSQLATIVALAGLAESRDDDTGEHIERTRGFCRALAEQLRRGSPYAAEISDSFIDAIDYSSALHDVGKVGIPDAILLKPGKLTPEEFGVMKTHTTIGAHALRSAHTRYQRNVLLSMGIEIARSHHEKWDGSGYPHGLAGQQIPLSARIVAIADVYDALRSRRVYKPPFDHDASVRIILEGSGGHFDPVVVDAFQVVAEVFATIRDQSENG
jgi:putative two-component system response regulator